jgi:hypothetical protein
MAHLIDAGKLTLKDVQEAERTLRKLSASARSGRSATRQSSAASAVRLWRTAPADKERRR